MNRVSAVAPVLAFALLIGGFLLSIMETVKAVRERLRQ